MFKKGSIFLICLLHSLCVTTISSFAQQSCDKYVVFIFEDVRDYKESGRTFRYHNDYYWILKLDDRYCQEVFPLYLPVDEKTIVENGDSVVLDNTPLSNLNGFAFSEIDQREYCYKLISWLHDNRIKKQVINTKNTATDDGSIRRVKERVRVFYVPVLGCFEKGSLRLDADKSIVAYYPVDINLMAKFSLNEEEARFVNFLDCSLVDFSAFQEAYDRHQKGFAILKNADQPLEFSNNLITLPAEGK